MYKYLIPAALAFVSFACSAQIPYIDSREVLLKGIDFYDKGDYKEALKQYALVNECDTNYPTAVYETMLTLNADSSFEAAKTLGLRSLSLPDINRREILLAIGASYDYLDKGDSAMAIYDSLIKLYPDDNQAWFEKGILYLRKNNYENAITCLQTSLLINPTHFRSYYTLGDIYILQGRLTEGMLALQGSLLITQDAKQAKKAIALIGLITEETDEVVKLYQNKPAKYSHPLFDDIDQIVNSKLALSSDYKLNVSLNDNVFRQLQVICEKLKYDPADTNFVMQYFVPLLTDVYSKDMFESYILFQFSGYGFENVDKLAEKKHNAVNEVKDVVLPYLDKIRSTRELNYVKRQKAIEMYHYYPNDNLIVEGASVPDGKDIFITGDAVFLRSTFTTKSKGRFDEKGKREGRWKFYYPSGVLSEDDLYVKDTVIDTSYTYYANGNRQTTYVLDKHGNTNEKYRYDYAGWLSYENKVIPGDLAEETSYYANGNKEYSFIYKDTDLADGNYKYYYKDGKVSKEFSVKSGKTNGPFKSYYNNGTLSEQATYLDGVRDGEERLYYENGMPKEKNNYANGDLDGPYEEYYDNGKLSEKGMYREGKKAELTRYTKTERVYGIMSLNKRSVPVKIKFMDEEGKSLVDIENSRGIYSYPLFNRFGVKSVDIKIDEDGKRDGILTFYYATGAKSEVSTYKDGDMEGPSTSFYENGNKKAESHYMNDELDGYYKSYYSNGCINSEGWYKAGQRQGLWKYYYVNGKVENETYYLNDKVDGFYKCYNEGGNITDKYMYKSGNMVAHVTYDTAAAIIDSIYNGWGKVHCRFNSARNDASSPALMEYDTWYSYMHGPFTMNYINGQVRRSSYYSYNNKDGVEKDYFPDGRPEAIGQYKNDKKCGHWKYYDEAGELIAEDSFDNQGNRAGAAKHYVCNELRIAYNFKDGDKDSAQIYYGENNRIAFILFYDEGDLTGYTYEGKDGKLLPPVKVKNGTADITTYYSNGTVSGKVNFIKNQVNGLMKMYYSNGQVAQERSMLGLDLDGPFKNYTFDGKLVYEFNYKNDEGDGVERTYDKNGNLIIEATYTCGALNGPTKVIDPSTNKVTNYYYNYGRLISFN